MKNERRQYLLDYYNNFVSLIVFWGFWESWKIWNDEYDVQLQL